MKGVRIRGVPLGMGRIHSEFGNLSDQSVPAGLVLRQEPDEEEEEEEEEEDDELEDEERNYRAGAQMTLG